MPEALPGDNARLDEVGTRLHASECGCATPALYCRGCSCWCHKQQDEDVATFNVGHHVYDVLAEVAEERERQAAKHGDQTHLPDGTGPLLRDPLRDDGTRRADVALWAKMRCKAASQNEGGNGTVTFEHILTEEFYEALAEEDEDALRAELIQVAAVAVQWIEAIDARFFRPATTGGTDA